VTTFAVEPGALSNLLNVTLEHLDSIGAADALWQRRLDLWPDDPPGARKIIGNRLGWLHALDVVEAELPRLRAFAAGVCANYQRVVLMGMGGSSLAPEVLRQVIGVAPGFPRFVMIDTVNPDAVRATFADPAPTLYVVASKSGTTIEPVSLAAEARRVATSRGGWSQNAVAITDPGTALHREAVAEGFRDVFVNPPDIGGRYSALSLFGMVPAALMGADLDALVASARGMELECRRTGAATNPGVALGALMAEAAMNKRDKMTLLLPPGFASFGLWVEQLVAESTGKRGEGIVPVTGERASVEFGADRCFVEVRFAGESPDADIVARARASGAPRMAIDVPRATDVAAEFLRWEVATAVAGAVLGINPFDEPNVQQAKDATRALLDAHGRNGSLPMPDAHAVVNGARLTFSSAITTKGIPRNASVLDRVYQRDYLAVLAYVPPQDAAWAAALDQARDQLARTAGVATTVAYGPRYLHSTGQLHKGGKPFGFFIIVSAEPEADLSVPGQSFSFGVLETAQAIGDFHSLDKIGQRAVFVRLPRADATALAPIIDVLAPPAR
jgi:transaldolase / glucose-6-phosphate isomerase